MKTATMVGLQVAALMFLLFMSQWRTVSIDQETDQDIADVMSQMGLWENQQNTPMLIDMHREDGDPNKPWDIQIIALDTKYEWDEIGFQRLDRATQQAREDYESFPTGHERKYHER